MIRTKLSSSSMNLIQMEWYSIWIR